MVTQTSIYSGASLFQEAFPISNFICSDNDGLIFVPSNSDPSELVTTAAYITHQPDDPNSIWAGVDIDWSRVTTDPRSILHALFTLYGITPLGDTVQVGEKVITSCPTSILRETDTFNLLQSACEPGLTVNPAVAPAGKVALNLPMTYKNFDDAGLYVVNADPYSTKMKIIPITGSIDGIESYWGTGPITVTYNSNMNVDFSDLRFYQLINGAFVWVPYQIIRKVNGVSATVFVQIASLPASPNVTNILMTYGYPAGTSDSTPLSNFYYYDDFEDGLVTGRTAPYQNMNVGAGTGIVTNTSPLNGTYSFKHTGNGSDSVSNRVYYNDGNPYFSATFNFKLLTQGVGVTICPYIVLFYFTFNDTSNYVRLETSYNGTNQLLQIRQAVAGVSTVYGSTTWLTGKMPINTTYKFYIRQLSTGWLVLVNGVQKINVAISPISTCTYKGFGANVDSVGMWDNLEFHIGTSTSVYLGNDPTIGTLGAELNTSAEIEPDSTGSDFTQLIFSKPSSWLDGIPGWFTTRKPANYNIPTRSVPMSATNTFSLGYDGMDKFDALRLGIFITANSNYNLNINSVTFRTG
jgi:hypothetical protein